ncbi:MAG: N-acetylglutaminylglutamine synthetase [Gammaproteobacteria bacterium]|nr:N-acetylglutaminylglutamine synthetase [Gammaproteobacteria bacterium]
MSARTRHRIERIGSVSLGRWRSKEPRFQGERLTENAFVNCGWGKLIFAHTFSSNRQLADAICNEESGLRNLALYLRDPHVVLAMAPQELFLDPSHTYRLWMANYRASRIQPAGFKVRRLQRRSDADHVQRLLSSQGMVSADPEFIWEQRASRVIEFFLAEDPASGELIGTVMGIDHREAFDDPENGSSMWCLAVDPQAQQPGVGRSLVANIADHYAARGRAFMDLSVMHDNTAVIRLYEDLGFERVPVFCVKRRNAINASLYTGEQPESDLNPYARIIVDEAVRRGIAVEVLDADHGYFALEFGGRRIVSRESLSELTTAVAMSRCDDKVVTHRVLAGAGVRVPEQRLAADPSANEKFLARAAALVVKPAQGEQGHGVSVNISDPVELEEAIAAARRLCDRVVLEEYVKGEDLRVVVIDNDPVAAAIRKPAQVVGTGRHTISTLIQKQSRRRAAATGGESRIPLDDETRRCLKKAGFGLDEVLAEGEVVRVRETANLHTGGTLHDVTDELSDELRTVSSRIARVLAIPVVGLDFIVDSAASKDYVLIEANERPGLANHEPQPTAERFVDLLFPQTATRSG